MVLFLVTWEGLTAPDRHTGCWAILFALAIGAAHTYACMVELQTHTLAWFFSLCPWPNATLDGGFKAALSEPKLREDSLA